MVKVLKSLVVLLLMVFTSICMADANDVNDVIIQQGNVNAARTGSFKNLVVDSNLIYTDSNNSRVGIGTTEPRAKLDVNGNIFAAEGNSVNWNTAYSWGNHAVAGYLTSETDPVFGASAAYGITSPNIANWNTAFGWGNHATAGYLTSETDPTVLSSVKDGVSWSEVSNRPAGLDDGDNVGITSESDPQVGSNTSNYIPKWNGSELVTGTVYDNGNVGIGTTSPGSKLEVAGNIICSNPTADNHAATKGYVDSGTVTMTNKTLTSAVLNTSVSGTAVDNDGNLAANSTSKLVTEYAAKKYVDNRITMIPSITGPGTGYAGEESIKLANGFIMKKGKTGNISGNTITTITFNTTSPNVAFTTTPVIVITPVSNGDVGQDFDNVPYITAISATQFSFKSAEMGNVAYNWIAMGN